MRSITMRMAGMSLKALALASVALFASPANATLIVSTGNTPSASNAISPDGCAIEGPATSIYGCLNTDHSIAVRFDSADENIKFHGNGQAEVLPGDDLGMNDLMISILGYTFSQLVLNIQAQADGTVTFSDNFADLPVTLSLAANGNNFFTITGGDFSFIRLDSSDAQFQIGHGPSATFVSDGDITHVKDIRFDGLKVPCTVNCSSVGNLQSVPEPSTLALFGAALLGFGFFGRRRQRQPQRA